MGGRNYCRDSVHWITCSSSGYWAVVEASFGSPAYQCLRLSTAGLRMEFCSESRATTYLFWKQWKVWYVCDLYCYTTIEPLWSLATSSSEQIYVNLFLIVHLFCHHVLCVLYCHCLPVWSWLEFYYVTFFWLYCTCASGSLSLSLMQQEVVPVVVKQSDLIWPVSP